MYMYTYTHFSVDHYNSINLLSLSFLSFPPSLPPLSLSLPPLSLSPSSLSLSLLSLSLSLPLSLPLFFLSFNLSLPPLSLSLSLFQYSDVHCIKKIHFNLCVHRTNIVTQVGHYNMHTHTLYIEHLYGTLIIMYQHGFSVHCVISPIID